MSKELYLEGCSLYSSGESTFDLFSRWNTTEPANYTLVAGHYEARAIRIATDVQFNIASCTWIIDDGNSDVKAGFGCYFSVDNVDSAESRSNRFFIALVDDGATMVGARIIDGGLLQICAYTNTTTIAATLYTHPEPLVSATRTRLDVWITAAGGAGVLKVRVNGVEVFSGSGLNTAGAGSQANGIQLLNGTLLPTAIKISDLYLSLGYDDCIAEGRIFILTPDSDNDVTNWTASAGTDFYALVNDSPTDTTQYITASNVNDRAKFGASNLAFDPVAIHGIQLVGFAHKTDAVARTVNLGISNPVDGVTDSPAKALALDNLHLTYPMYRNPVTVANWTKTEMDASILEFNIAA